MTYRAVFLSICVLASGDAALGQESGTAQPPAARLPQTVDDFFARAVDEGLLLPVGSEPSANDEQGSPEASVFICPEPQALDLSPVADLRSHAAMVAVLVGLRGRRTGEPGSESYDARLALKARLAVGLYAELIAQADDRGDPGAQALIEIARYLESRSERPGDYLEKLAACSARGLFWSSIPALERGDMSGVAGFREGLSEFRSLPFFLQADISAMVVPRLAEQGQHVLAQTLMASFDEADLAASAQLRFAAATLAMHADRENGVRVMREQMRHPQFRDLALSRLANSRAPMSMAAIDVLQSDMVAQFAELRSDADRLALIDFWITQARARGDVSIIEELLAIPSLADPVSREKIAKGLSELLGEKIEGDSEASALHALGLISSGRDLAQMARSDSSLMTKSIHFANKNEMPALARHLAGLSTAPISAGALMASRLKQAELALARGDHRAVIEAALERPDSPELADLAVRAALRSSDASALDRVLANVQPSPSQALIWLEEDTLHSRFLLPDEFVSLARTVEGSDEQRRLAIAERLRSGITSAAGPAPAASFVDLLQVLERPGADQRQGG